MKYLYCFDRTSDMQYEGGPTSFIAIVEEEFFKERGCLDSVSHDFMCDLGFPSAMEAVYECYMPEDEARKVLNTFTWMSESAELSKWINGDGT